MIKSINDVIERQSQIVELASSQKARFGYFASLYMEMTKSVKRNMEEGKFDDNERMEKLVVVFAQRYFDAFDLWQAKSKPTQAWQLAFDEVDKNNLTVIQHLLCNINAHINLDLGIAAAQICRGDKIEGLKKDFERINDVLASLLDTIQVKLGKICWPMKLLDRVGKNGDEQLANFCLGTARKSSWLVALSLAKLPEHKHPDFIGALDNKTSLLAKLIINPGIYAGFVLKLVKWFEPKDPASIIDVFKT